jgi:isocitrate lyase
MWMETAKPILAEAKHFANEVRKVVPNQMFAYNLSPSFNWDEAGMTDEQIRTFQDKIGEAGFVWQVTYFIR